MNHNIDDVLRSKSLDNFVKMMIDIKDDDNCWCGSNKKYKNCHKGTEFKKRVPEGKVNLDFKLLKVTVKLSTPDKKIETPAI